jgi:uncharacterized protein (TIGR03435 family)
MHRESMCILGQESAILLMQYFVRSAAVLILVVLTSASVPPSLSAQQPQNAVVAQSSATSPSQSAIPTAPVFDVAAIHLHQPEPHEHNSIWSSPFDGHFKATNISVVMLIHWAYVMPETRILGAPAWAANTMFNIDAAADPSLDEHLHGLNSDTGRTVKEKMVRALLADRFKLATHSETRELPIYTLVVAKGGAKLGDSKSDGTNVNHGRDHIEVEGSNSLVLLAEELSKEVGRPVIDRTGIAGRYDLTLKWTPDDRVRLTDSDSADSNSGPSLFTALQEQLGLKLESAKGPVQVLVIDHVEMPTEN